MELIILVVTEKPSDLFKNDLAQVVFFVSMAKSELKIISGRHKISPTKKELDLAIQYVKISGLYKNRLADYMSVSRRTLYRQHWIGIKIFTQPSGEQTPSFVPI